MQLQLLLLPWLRQLLPRWCLAPLKVLVLLSSLGMASLLLLLLVKEVMVVHLLLHWVLQLHCLLLLAVLHCCS
jgi:hypothetical protein